MGINERAKRNIGLMIALIVMATLTAALLTWNGKATQAGMLKTTSQRVIEFAGQQWNVKSGCGLGPGPNCWSDSEESVWVDNGQLHLKIREIGGTWYSAEVYTTICTHYGMHRFFVTGRVDELDKNVIAAPFLYADDLTEIDIEFAKWGVEAPSTNAQYVVQPYAKPGNLERFPMVLSDTLSTHYINWQADAINFKSIQGHYEEPPATGDLIHEWVYTGGDIPADEDCLRVHINLWLYQGQAPSDGEEVEIVIADAQLPGPKSRTYLPQVRKDPPPTPTPTPTPWITVNASGNQVWGEVGPTIYCNSNYKVALYAKTDIWYVQPYTDARRDIWIDTNCEWRSSTNTWYQLAAHLVPASYYHPDTIHTTAMCPPPPLNPATNPNILATDCYP